MADRWSWEAFEAPSSPAEVADRSRPRRPVPEPEPVGLSG